jgi:hypothetical protein
MGGTAGCCAGVLISANKPCWKKTNDNAKKEALIVYTNLTPHDMPAVVSSTESTSTYLFLSMCKHQSTRTHNTFGSVMAAKHMHSKSPLVTHTKPTKRPTSLETEQEHKKSKKKKNGSARPRISAAAAAAAYSAATSSCVRLFQYKRKKKNTIGILIRGVMPITSGLFFLLVCLLRRLLIACITYYHVFFFFFQFEE